MPKRAKAGTPFRMACLATALLAAGGAIAAGSARTDPVIEPGIVSTAAAEIRIAYRPDGRQIVWGSIGREAAPHQHDIW